IEHNTVIQWADSPLNSTRHARQLLFLSERTCAYAQGLLESFRVVPTREQEMPFSFCPMMDKRWFNNNRPTSIGRRRQGEIRGPLMISQLVRASILAAVCVTAFATESTARSPYDGAWSVLIVTTRGDCDRAYRYGISIINGYIRYEGGMVAMSGRV